MNRVIGTLEAIAGGILIKKSEEYGFGVIGKMGGLYLVAQGIGDLITGKFCYLTSKIKGSYFKK